MDNNIENTNITNNNTAMPEKKNNSLIVIIIAIIILAIVAIVVVKGKNANKLQNEENITDQTTTDINNALSADTTTEINSNLDKINLEDTSTNDLKSLDDEIQKL